MKKAKFICPECGNDDEKTITITVYKGTTEYDKYKVAKCGYCDNTWLYKTEYQKVQEKELYELLKDFREVSPDEE